MEAGNNKNSSEEEKRKYGVHEKSRQDTYAERQGDRKIKDAKIGILCIDLQQVIALPQANVSSFY